MATLKMPQLNLFNQTRKIQNNRSIYEGLTNLSENAIRASQKERISYPRNIDIPTRQYEPLYTAQFRQPHLPHRYRDIADVYLDKRIPLPIYPQPLPYIEPLMLYDNRASRYKISPKRYRKECQCQNQQQIINRKTYNKNSKQEKYRYTQQQQPFKKAYIDSSQYNTQRYKNSQKKNHDDLIKKDPYLIATFRKDDKNISGVTNNYNNQSKLPSRAPSKQNTSNVINNIRNNPNAIRIDTNESVHVEDKNISAHFLNQKVAVTNAEVQTLHQQQNKSMMLISKVIKKAPGIMDEKNFKKTITQQTNHFYNIEYQPQDQYRIDFSDLQQTKDQYFQKSRQLLFRLNQLSQDKKEFALMGKLFLKTNQKKTQISWPTLGK